MARRGCRELVGRALGGGRVTAAASPGAVRERVERRLAERRRGQRGALRRRGGAPGAPVPPHGRALRARRPAAWRSARRPPARSDARHVAVEFVHPVIVGKRALPALGLTGESGPVVRELDLVAEPDDIVDRLRRARRRAELAQALALARERGCLTVAFAPLGAEWELEPPSDDPFVRQELVETAYHVLWELVHVFFEHRGLLEGRTEQPVHDAGASSFLYPFLGEQEHDLDAVLADVARLGGDEGRRGRRAARRRRSATAARRCAPRRPTCARPSTPAGGCWRSATAARPPTRWTWSPTSPGRRPPAAGPRAARSTSPRTRRSSPRSPTTSAPRRSSRARSSPTGDAATSLLALSTSGNSLNVIAALAEARRRGLRTIALVGYDGGRVAAEGLADHVVVTRSEHIPRIQEAQASAYHVAAGARGVMTRRASGRVEGMVQGVGFRPFVYRLAARARARRLRAQRRARRAARGRGRRRRRSSASWRGCRPRRRRWPRSSASRGRRCRRPGERGFRILASAARRRARRAGRRRHRDLRRLPGRAVRPGRPPLPLPVRQLHQLRPALHDRARRPLRPAADDDGRLRDVRRAARPSTTTRADRRFHAQPNACPDCGPAVRLRRTPTRRRRAAPRPRRRCSTARSSRSRAWAATTSRAAPTTSAAVARAARAQAPRGPAVRAHGAPTSRRRARWSTLGEAEAALLAGRERPIVLAPRRAGAPRGGGGRAAQRRARRDAALLAAAPPAARRRRRRRS